MNKRIHYLTLFVFIIISSVANSQTRSGFDVTFHAGTTIPTGNITKESSAGFFGGLELDYKLYNNLNLYASGGYNNFSMKEERTILANGEIIQTGLGLRYVIPYGMYKLYFKIGANMYFYDELQRDTQGVITGQSKKENNPGMTAGTGYIFRLSRNVDFYSQINYNQVFDDENDINFMQINAGITIGF